ncbi:TRAP transporter small permease [Roseinatronobacter sp. S2]|uniref:TRAP transporter small permease n=1 Tax=Roseinatronobacter sp. S2 TaxID=3035471 RepID=UPI0024106F61|nr:TRAP transporter small permease [Roseinatronobacter sp. S2]WFE76745.1 TRAP transporter small permease [Roseinatronobacter sp. S2]
MAETRENPIMRAIRALDLAGGWVDRLLQAGMIFVLSAIFVLMFSQVVLRYIIFVPFPWIEELAAMLLPVLAVWGSAICIRHGTHLQVDFLLIALPDTIRLVLQILTNALIVYFAYKICQAGFVLAELGRNELTTSRSISLYWPRMSIVIGGGLLILQSAILILKDSARMAGWLPMYDEKIE